MLGRHVAWRRAEGKLSVETRRPAIAVAALMAVRAAQNRQVILGEIHSGVVPRVAVATVPGFHGDQRRLRGIARGVLEERTR